MRENCKDIPYFVTAACSRHVILQNKGLTLEIMSKVGPNSSMNVNSAEHTTQRENNLLLCVSE